MNDNLFIAKIRVYETPSDEAKANFSVGISVASRLNGDEDLVGTFDPNAEAKALKVGFITFRKKFMEREKADLFRESMMKKYRVASTMNPRKWAWGDLDKNGTTVLGSGAIVHMVKYLNVELSSSKEIINHEAANEKMKFKGKVVEPV